MEGSEWPHHLDGNETFYLTDPSTDGLEWKKVIERAEKVQARLRQVLRKLPLKNYLYLHRMRLLFLGYRYIR